MSVIKNNPKFKEFNLRKIYEYLIEREEILEMENNIVGAHEVKKLLVFMVTNFSQTQLAYERNRKH